MDPQTMAQMDKVSGLSAQDVSNMDQISGLGGNQGQPTQTDNPIGGGVGKVVRGGSDFMRTIGLGAIPNAAANIYDIGKSALTGQKISQQSNYDDPFRTQSEVQKQVKSNPIVSGLKDTAGAASWMLPELNVLKGGKLASAAGNASITGAAKGGLAGIAQQDATPGSVAGYAGMGAILGPLFSMLKSGKMTQNGVNKAMEAAKNESVASGATKTWDDIITEANQKLGEGPNQFRPDLQREVQKVLATRTPAATLGNVEMGASEAAPKGITTGTLTNELDANQLHNFRQALDKSIPKNAWNNPNIRPVGVEANMLVRQIMGDALHEIAPKTQFLDNLSHMYHNPLFNNTFGLPKLGSTQVKQIPAGIPAAALKVALGSILGEGVAKKLGI